MAKNRDNFNVVPAHAGVILGDDGTDIHKMSSTRTRGGDPLSSESEI